MLLAPLLAFAALAQGPPPSPDVPALISADQITYDENLGVVSASGNVEIAQENRVLFADSVSYNLRTNVVTASGHVALLEPTGEAVFADFVELTDDLREGFIRDIRVLMTDRSRLAAANGLRTGGNKTVFRKGVFSPCELCREDPTRAPLWQLKAIEVEHDQEEKVIRYRDAWMEIFGVPVLYTPYFQHPDPTVKRKSGFLAPTFGASDILGTTYQQPYFWAIAEDKDVTVAPIVTSDQGVVMAAQYRHLLPTGALDLRVSGTVADRESSAGTIEENRFRGHIDGTVRFDIDETWRWGIDAQRATDDTYLRVYNFSDERTLTSRAFIEGLHGRNYLAANSYLYQGLRATDDDGQSPIIFPLIDYNYISEPGFADSTYSLDASLLALSRTQGPDTRRLSTAVSWDLPYQGPLGDLYTVTARLQGDGYWTNGFDADAVAFDPSEPTDSDLTGRIFPQLAVEWRYPWVRHDGSVHQVVQPIAQAVLAPNGSNPGDIPNEDSLDFEFDDTNLFSLNRFTGVDRVDPGTRFDYGLEWSATTDSGRYVSAFAGQSYRISEADVFADGSGVEENFSDYVGRVELRPFKYVDLLYRFRLDKDDLSPRRNELDLRIGPPALNLDLSYISLDSEAAQDEFGSREELTWILRSRLSQYWSAYGGLRVDLDAKQTRQARIGVAYQDECFLIEGIVERNFFEDREIEPEDVFFVNIVFTHLGGLSSGEGAAF